MAALAPDVSEYQDYLTERFGRRLLIARVNFGAHYQDQHFARNAAVAAELYRRGAIDGVILYAVYLASASPAEQYAWTWRLIGPTPPPWLIGIELDVESWPGTSYSISGDHSRQLNTLYGMHAHRMGHWSACIGYGNRSDLAEIWPHRDPRCEVIVANYGSDWAFRRVRGAIGQQYTDGSSSNPVPRLNGELLPRASAEFGHCDHNVFPDYKSAASLRTALRPATTPAPKRTPTPSKKAGGKLPQASASPHYPDSGDSYAHGLASPNRAFAQFITDDGHLEIRHNGAVTRTL